MKNILLSINFKKVKVSSEFLIRHDLKLKKEICKCLYAQTVECGAEDACLDVCEVIQFLPPPPPPLTCP
jgi:hypothetical protein